MALRAGLFLLAVFFASSALVLSAPLSRADPAGTMAASASVLPELERDMAGFRVGLKTDDQVVEREEEAIRSDRPSVREQKLAEAAERFEFQAEVHRLMDIIINSLYQKKEIFLRELISNASDALDKIRFMSLSDRSVLGEGEQADLDIRISFDKEKQTLTIRDRGVGMTKQDLIQNLGTVAKSGTSQFVEAVANGADINLIGQFGVGFYSVYLVADKVQVRSKHNDDEQYVWESTADSSFSVTQDPEGSTLGRGTEVTLFLKEDAHLEFTNQDTLETLIRRYSEFITFPIHLWKGTDKQVLREELEAEEAAQRAAERAARGEEEEESEELAAEDEEEKKEEDEKNKPKYVTKTTWAWERINNQAAIWTRSKDDIAEEEYKGFYKAITKDTEDPLTWTHFKAEGEIEFKAILYIPKHAPFDQFENYYGKVSSLRLYVRKVLITDEFDELIPRYLSFIKGVVDSDDLPLNVSRETLQQHRVLKVMGKKLVRKVLELLRKMAQQSEKAQGEEGGAEAGEEQEEQEGEEEGEVQDLYTQFWKEFGKNIKMGVIEDQSNRSKLSKLVRFMSSKSNGRYISLDEYTRRMKPWQRDIYYIAGESVEAVENSAFLERLNSKDLEVLYLVDPIDEYCAQNLVEYDGKRLQSVTKEGLKFGDESSTDRDREKAYKSMYKSLTGWLQEVYGDKVERVTVSNRVEKTPCVLVTSQYGYTANMERIMKSQAFGDPSKTKFLVSRRIMELNPRHPIIAELNRRAAESPEDPVAKDLAMIMLDTALLQSGFSIDEPRHFAQRMYTLMQSGLQLETLDLLPEVDPATVLEQEADEAGADGEEEEYEAEDEEEEEAGAAQDDVDVQVDFDSAKDEL